MNPQAELSNSDWRVRGIALPQTHSQETPVSLLEQLRVRPDGPAWDRFVQLYTPFLYHCVRQLGLQQADAADLLQDVFLVLYQTLPDFSYNKDKSFHGWLRTVLVNKRRDMVRKKNLAPASAAGLSGQLPATDNVAEWAEEEFQRFLVHRALELMQRDFQPATWQACWETTVKGRNAQDVARQLGLSVDAVYAANYRVLRRLRQELEGMFS
jgi:RNA polymerase sigma-70 factor (ECF subfamily)